MAHEKHEHEPKHAAPKEKPKPVAPRYENGQLTYDGMEAVLAEGGSVLYQGQVISSPSQLPSRVDFAKGNAEAEKALEAHLDAEMGKLAAQKAKLRQPEAKKEK